MAEVYLGDSRQYLFIPAVGIGEKYLELAHFGAILTSVDDPLTIRRKRNSNRDIVCNYIGSATEHRCSQETFEFTVVIFRREKVEIISIGGERRGRVIRRSCCHDLRVAVCWKVLQKETSLAILLDDTEDVFAIGRNRGLAKFTRVRQPCDREVLKRYSRFRSEESAKSIACRDEQQHPNHNTSGQGSFSLFSPLQCSRTPGFARSALIPAVASVMTAAASTTRAAVGVSFASPKSRILACLCSVTKMFAGFMSR